jgi:hypothetical protein
MNTKSLVEQGFGRNFGALNDSDSTGDVSYRWPIWLSGIPGNTRRCWRDSSAGVAPAARSTIVYLLSLPETNGPSEVSSRNVLIVG